MNPEPKTHSAFPHGAMELAGGWNIGANPGISLRDYFASNSSRGAADAVCSCLEDGDAEAALREAKLHACAAYMVADAMLEAREK